MRCLSSFLAEEKCTFTNMFIDIYNYNQLVYNIYKYFMGGDKVEIEAIQSLYNDSKINWSKHCLERMQERDITIDDVRKCINTGEIIEDYPADFPHPNCLIFGYTLKEEILHTVVGSDGNTLFIITAYYPSTDKFGNDLKTRKEK